MLVKIEDKSAVEKQLFFTVEKSAVDLQINSFVKDITPRVEVKGFRKGTAPASVVRTHFKDIILSECSARLVQEEVAGTVREKNLKIVGSPILIEEDRASKGRKYVGQFGLDGTFNFSVMADFQPEVVVRIPADLTVSELMPSLDELVEADIQALRASMAQLEFVEREATVDDQVSVEFTDGGNSHVSVVLSEQADAFADNSAFIGKKSGDEFEVALKDGRAATARVSAVFARTLPQIDDEFAKSAMFDSLEDMRKDFAAKKDNNHSAPLKAKLYNEILSQLIASNPIDIPERWVDTEFEIICKRVGLKSAHLDNSSFVTQLREQAARNLRSNLLLDAIYTGNENIHMSADETFGIVEAEAKKIGRSADEVLTHLRNSGQYENLISFYERNKAIEFLISQAKVKQENK